MNAYDRLLYLSNIIAPFLEEHYYPLLKDIHKERDVLISEINTEVSLAYHTLEALKKEIDYEITYKDKIMKEFKDVITSCPEVKECNVPVTLNLVFKRIQGHAAKSSFDGGITFGTSKRLRTNDFESPTSLLSSMKQARKEMIDSLDATIMLADSVYIPYETKFQAIECEITSLQSQLITMTHSYENLRETSQKRIEEIRLQTQEKAKNLFYNIPMTLDIANAIAEKNQIMHEWNDSKGIRCSACNAIEKIEDILELPGFKILHHYSWVGLTKIWNCKIVKN